MSLRDTWTRRNRALFRDSRTAHLSAVEAVVLEQVWAIACDEGEADGDDVLVPADALEPAEVLLELPRSPDFSLDAVGAAVRRLSGLGFIEDAAPGVVRVGNVARYNSRRFQERSRKRQTRAPSTGGQCELANAVRRTGEASPRCRRGAVQDSSSTGQNYNNTPRQAGGGGAAPGGAADGKPSKRPSKAKQPDPSAVQLADAHLAAIRLWKPDAADNCHSASSLEAYRLMLAGGRKAPPRLLEDALGLVAWLYDPDGYQPRTDFDWRVNVLSGDALRRQWDRLTTERERQASGSSRPRTTTDDSLAAIERVRRELGA